jgi:WS/DGAT/MGAT family acyltransferase
MDQLRGIDSGVLAMETSRAPAHSGLLTIFDPIRRGRPLTADDVTAVLAERLHLMPPLRRRLAEVPLGLDRPYWFEDPDFDLDFHVRRTGLPSPGTDAQLAELVARVHARPLDRSRPLWELYVIEGLPGGRTAQFTKIHHAAIDAATGMDLMSALLDTSRNPPPVEPPPVPWSPDRRPGPAEMLTRAVASMVSRPRAARRVARPLMSALAGVAGQQLPPLMQTAREVLERVPGVRELPGLRGDSAGNLTGPARPGVTAPRTSFNQRITEHRRVAFCTLDFADLHRVRDAFGVTVNDVVLAVCAGALRSWLGDRRELPTDPLLALVPVSVRDAHDGAQHSERRGPTADSRVSAVVTVLATHEPDPRRRIAMIAAAAADARRSLDAVPASLLADVSAFTSPALASLAARTVASTKIANIANPPFNLVITNVPGPQQPLWCAGARQVGTYAVPVINDGVGLNLSAMSYDGKVHVGAVACRELMPDLWGLVDRIPAALDELHSLTRQTTKKPPRNKATRSKPTQKNSTRNTSTQKKPNTTTQEDEPHGRTA